MNFGDAWAAFGIDDQVEVSNGKAPPSIGTGPAYKAWRSNNFTGTVADKIDGDYRVMRVRMVDADFAPDAEDNAIIWTLVEGAGHDFRVLS